MCTGSIIIRISFSQAKIIVSKGCCPRGRATGFPSREREKVRDRKTARTEWSQHKGGKSSNETDG